MNLDLTTEKHISLSPTQQEWKCQSGKCQKSKSEDSSSSVYNHVLLSSIVLQTAIIVIHDFKILFNKVFCLLEFNAIVVIVVKVRFKSVDWENWDER